MERSFVFVSRGRYETLPEGIETEGTKKIPSLIKSNISSVNGANAEVTEYKLNQNYPNPFNPLTTIYYDVKENGFVSLIVYDLLGKEVKTLVNEHKIKGKHSVNFNALDISSGIYVCRMRVNEFASIMKMVVLK